MKFSKLKIRNVKEGKFCAVYYYLKNFFSISYFLKCGDKIFEIKNPKRKKKVKFCQDLFGDSHQTQCIKSSKIVSLSTLFCRDNFFIYLSKQKTHQILHIDFMDKSLTEERKSKISESELKNDKKRLDGFRAKFKVLAKCKSGELGKLFFE